MRYTVHQVLVKLTAEALAADLCGGSIRFLVTVEHGDLLVDDLVDEFFGNTGVFGTKNQGSIIYKSFFMKWLGAGSVVFYGD